LTNRRLVQHRGRPGVRRFPGGSIAHNVGEILQAIEGIEPARRVGLAESRRIVSSVTRPAAKRCDQWRWLQQ